MSQETSITINTYEAKEQKEPEDRDLNKGKSILGKISKVFTTINPAF